jgi:hypothetical protein
VPKYLFKPPAHLIKEWPEVFEDLYMNTIPVAYIDLIHIEFKNGSVWEINVAEQLIYHESDILAERLLDTLSDYKNDITSFDFKVNVDKLKNDVQSSSKKIL